MNSKVDFAAGGIVFYNNLIVIVKNKRHGEDSDNSFWGYPKGHLEDGEKPSDAALREVYEETGFKVKLANDTPIAESRYEITLENEVINKTVWFYEMEVIKAFDKEPDNEIDELAVLGYEDALKLLTFEEDKKILKYVFNK
ncbi:MAG: NUDIX domain-containing protein [Candidatus Actinomarina sp.]|jgi:8-oxo-dGTP pyrophosphatase MutT (NUDIX family)|nr:NUDIX domain-containing protein [Actinomycetota bacterium]MBL6836904.1 NUDIX domain-containing protein [Candidatus Actinomarina sp.]